ncbi:helix-turn-helix domain-containing protein [Micromonospora zamorensis]|uniref:helix-turn-helix domain-containing protein n=1 Tax=Micromonospora zamorensis TaxID=709883 RepID=UPI0036C233C8
MSQPSERLGQSVAELRKLRGMSTRQLADRLDQLGHRIAQSSLSKIEAGKRSVDVDDLVALALALNTTPNRLLFGERAGAEAVRLTPKVITIGHRAWAWANGDFPLTSTYPKDMSEPEILDDFARSARPVDLRLRRQHPALRAARRLAALIDGLLVARSRPAVDGSVVIPDDDLLHHELDSDLWTVPTGYAADPAAVVAQALRRAGREVEELLEESGGPVPSE